MAVVLLSGSTAHAQTILNWESYVGDAWNSGNGFSRTYSLLAGYGNVTIAFTASGGGSTSEFSAGYPIVDQFGSGGLPSSRDAGLDIDLDLTNRSHSMTTTFTFDKPGGVSKLGFWLADVDRSGSSWQDRITITALLDSGATANATYSPAVPSRFTISGATITAATNNNAAATSSNGNVFVRIPDHAKAFTLIYGNGPLAGTNPSEQYITLHNLAVPEPATALLALLGLPLLLLRRRLDLECAVE